MKCLLTAAAVVVAASAAPAQAGSVSAASMPELDGQWTEAAPLPFEPTPDGFKEYLNQNGWNVSKATGCRLSESPVAKYDRKLAKQWRLPEHAWSHGYREYRCQQVFFTSTDPRGTRSCMGIVWAVSRGSVPGKPAELKLRDKTLKNDCRWL